MHESEQRAENAERDAAGNTVERACRESPVCGGADKRDIYVQHAYSVMSTADGLDAPL